MGGFLFLSTLYLQDARGYSALRAGLLMMPMAVMGGGSAVVSGWLVARRGPRLPLSGAGALIAVGAALLMGLSAHSAVWYLIVAYLVFGAGAGLVAPPITNAALSGMPKDQAGVAGAVASTCRQIGAALGVAVTGAIIAGSAAGFLHASHAAWAVLAGCGAMVVLLGMVSTGRWALATAERNGARLAADMSPAPSSPVTTPSATPPGNASVPYRPPSPRPPSVFGPSAGSTTQPSPPVRHEERRDQDHARQPHRPRPA
jgi:MFS family permease